jgi:hypothetical protein
MEIDEVWRESVRARMYERRKTAKELAALIGCSTGALSDALRAEHPKPTFRWVPELHALLDFEPPRPGRGPVRAVPKPAPTTALATRPPDHVVTVKPATGNGMIVMPLAAARQLARAVIETMSLDELQAWLSSYGVDRD